MKASTQFHALHIGAAALGFLAVFHAVLGLPNWIGIAAVLLCLICLWSVRQLMRRTSERGEHIFPQTQSPPKTKRLWIFPLLLFVLCFGLPFILPDAYGGVTLSLRDRVIVGGALYVLLPTLISVIRLRRRQNDLTNRCS